MAQSVLTQAACPGRLQAQVLIILDQVLHHLVHMRPSRLPPLDQADAALVTIPFLVMVSDSRKSDAKCATSNRQKQPVLSYFSPRSLFHSLGIRRHLRSVFGS